MHRVVRVAVLPLIGSGGAYGVDDREKLCSHRRWLPQQEVERGHAAAGAVGLREPLGLPESHGSKGIGLHGWHTRPQREMAVAYMPQLCYAPRMPRKTAHEVAVNALLSEEERADYTRRVAALRSRNALLTTLESTREALGITKGALASRAGLDASSVRRLLTSATANPTTDNAFRLMAAMDIKLEATLPTGERVELVSPGAQASSVDSAVTVRRLDSAA
jgi:DNA-binding phage protein